MPLQVALPKPDRSHVDPGDKACVHHLIKASGKSKAQVLAAIAKVGNNLESVQRELGIVRR
jgi:hypothetical protein